jgi:hypothetical protein
MTFQVPFHLITYNPHSHFYHRKILKQPLMKLSIHLYAAGLSLSYTVPFLDSFSIGCYRTTAHNLVR